MKSERRKQLADKTKALPSRARLLKEARGWEMRAAFGGKRGHKEGARVVSAKYAAAPRGKTRAAAWRFASLIAGGRFNRPALQ